MGKVVLSINMSVDGYVADSTGDIGWLFKHLGPQAHGVVMESLHNTDTLVLGRVNYELMAPVWPGQSNPLADLMNSLPKLVFSNTLKDVDWVNTRLAKGDPTEELTLLKEQTDKDIRLLGGPGIAQSLTKLGLIDRYELLTVPEVVGSGGLPLFKERISLKLDEVRNLDSSCVMQVYSRG